MNSSYVVASTYKCDDITVDMENFRPSPVWRTTALGCKILQLLQEMYNFEMTYVYGSQLWDPKLNGTSLSYESTPDIYARPLALRTDSFEYSSPIQAIIKRRYGFILRRPDTQEIRDFFRQPFTTETWICLFITIFIISLVLYVLCAWEKKVVGPWTQEYSFIFELLVMFGACCQHIPPVNPILTSRRIGYLTFFCFSYIVYSFYTSNLLSHLVNEKDKLMTLSGLVESDYEFIALDSLQMHIWRRVHTHSTAPLLPGSELTLLKSKVEKMKYLNIPESLKAVGNTRVALLSDYVTVYPYMRSAAFDNQVICDLIEVNLFSNIKEYLFTSKTFPLKKEFKVGVLRIIETGILKRVKRDSVYSSPSCYHTQEPQATFLHILVPLITLASCMFASILILIAERVYFQRNRVWPYVD